MPAPVVGATTTRLYARLPEYLRASDAELDYPLLRFLSLVVDQASEVEELLDRWQVFTPDEGGDPGDTSELVDPDLADAEWLPWLGQQVGAKLRPAMSEAETRANIAGASTGWQAGTRAGIAAAARDALTGNRTVDVIQAYGGDPWVIAVRTVPIETPSAPAVLAAIIEAGAKPAAYNLVVASFQATWDAIVAARANWAAIEAAGSWDAIESTGL